MDDNILYFLEPIEWLQDEDTGKKYWSLARKQRAMEFDLYSRLCSVNSTLIEMLFRVRRKKLDLDDDEQGRVNVTVFSEDDIEEVFESDNELVSFTVNQYYPKNDDDLLVYEIPK